MLTLLLCSGSAAAEDAPILGQPFPDFLATDTEGNVFVLSEALKDREAALINVWASWCAPCEAEISLLNEAYERYGDRVAFVALSCEETDTMEKIEAYRQAYGLSFPMGRDEENVLYGYLGEEGLPATVIVDRFSRAAFLRYGSFLSAGDVMRVVEAFLGDGYTETTVLTDVPRDASTRAFPVSPVRAIHVENEDVRTILFWVAGEDTPTPAYVLSDNVAHMRLELLAADDPATFTYYDYHHVYALQDLLDPERNAYVIDQPMPNTAAGEYYVCVLLTSEEGSDDDMVAAYLLRNEEDAEALSQEMRSWGYEVTWDYGELAQPEQAAPQAYVLHIVDQYGQSVPGVAVIFCTDTVCAQLVSDETGTIRFTGEPDAYHVQLFRAPEGYSFDPSYELNTGRAYGEWLLRVRRDGN